MAKIDEEEQRQSRPTQRTRQSVSAPKRMTYEVKEELPPYPDVMLAFEGLLWFIFHGTDECQVGIHNSTQGTFFPHRHPHDLSLTVWEIPDRTMPQNCTPTHYPIGNPKTIAGIQIDVNNPVYEGVYVFEKDPKDPFKRDENSHPNDWRWVLDFDREPLYPQGVKLDAEKINPGVWINHGTFYTLHKTKSKFSLFSEYDGHEYKLGNVPQYVGGNIYLKDLGDVTIRIRHMFPSETKPIVLKKKTRGAYQVDIKNVCMKNGQHCYFDPDDASKKGRNDFYLYYDTCATPEDADEFLLKRVEHYDYETPKICLTDTDKAQAHLRSSNDAPCGPVASGGGGS